MGGTRSFRALRVEQRQVPGGAVDGVSADRAGVATGKIRDLIRRVHVRARRRKRQACRVRIIGNDLALDQHAISGIHFEHVNTLPAALRSFRPLR